MFLRSLAYVLYLAMTIRFRKADMALLASALEVFQVNFR